MWRRARHRPAPADWPCRSARSPAPPTTPARHHLLEIRSAVLTRTPFAGSLRRTSPALGRAFGKFPREGLGNRRMYERLQVSVVLRDLPDDARADVGRLDRGHHEDRLEAFGQVAIHQRHLELVLEIADRTQTANVQRRPDFLVESDQEPFKLSYFDALLVGGGEPNELNSFVRGKQRFLGRV